jgi:hypothetical protein
MTRLREEIDILRSSRSDLMEDLEQGAKEMANAVSAMLADFSAAHASMARKTKKERVAYVTGIKKRVNKMRKETASDLMGARRAWQG